MNQVTSFDQAKEKRMVTYLVDDQEMLNHFEQYQIIHILIFANTNVDSLATANIIRMIPIKFLP